jgi:8-oxo-dGTP pyrophosphatase MutT (NUDIX family)
MRACRAMGFEGTTLWRIRQRVGTDLVLWPGSSVMVVRDDERVLLGRRLDNRMWAIPGGGAEEGSSFLETAIAELREEVGLEADPADLEAFASISRVDNHLETYSNGDVTHYFGSPSCARLASVSTCIARGSRPDDSRPIDHLGLVHLGRSPGDHLADGRPVRTRREGSRSRAHPPRASPPGWRSSLRRVVAPRGRRGRR